MSRALDKFQGNHGLVVTSATGSPVTGEFWSIACLADTTFSAITGDYTGTLTGVTIPAGMTLYGHFSAYTVGTGRVIAYKAA